MVENSTGISVKWPAKYNLLFAQFYNTKYQELTDKLKNRDLIIEGAGDSLL